MTTLISNSTFNKAQTLYNALGINHSAKNKIAYMLTAVEFWDTLPGSNENEFDDIWLDRVIDGLDGYREMEKLILSFFNDDEDAE